MRGAGRTDGAAARTISGVSRRAIVLCAGTGSRLLGPLPKTIRLVGGVPLVVRTLRALAGAGIDDIVVVTGYRGEQVRQAIAAWAIPGARLRFVHNDAFEQKNGVSLLAAGAYVDRECVLSMGDHLYGADLLRPLLACDLGSDGHALAVDRGIARCFDLADATKVRLRGGSIADIGKDLVRYDGIDAGVFRVRRELVDELDRLWRKDGDCELSEGVRALAARGHFYGCDIGTARWIDVDTPEARDRAEALVGAFGDSLAEHGVSGDVLISRACASRSCC